VVCRRAYLFPSLSVDGASRACGKKKKRRLISDGVSALLFGVPEQDGTRRVPYRKPADRGAAPPRVDFCHLCH
jgi:hypothetical protein